VAPASPLLIGFSTVAKVCTAFVAEGAPLDASWLPWQLESMLEAVFIDPLKFSCNAFLSLKR
jgi:hypothetical protein